MECLPTLVGPASSFLALLTSNFVLTGRTSCCCCYQELAYLLNCARGDDFVVEVARRGEERRTNGEKREITSKKKERGHQAIHYPRQQRRPQIIFPPPKDLRVAGKMSELPHLERKLHTCQVILWYTSSLLPLLRPSLFLPPLLLLPPRWSPLVSRHLISLSCFVRSSHLI
jgi:hypothetical protein